MSDSTVDPYDYLLITPNADGTFTRDYSRFPLAVATPDSDDDPHSMALSKDVTVNQSNNISVRIFLPRQALDFSSPTTKLPIIVHFHGGGFIICSPATNIFHNFCTNIAPAVPAVIVSVDYRLAPEHRLPAAHDDAMEVLHWIKTTQEDWLIKYADFTSCFLMGDSAGGSLAYYSGLRAAADVDKLLPLKIKGLILNQPFFGGVKRTESELRLINDPILPLCVTDLIWELALPIGAERDHEYCNPTVGGGSKFLEQIKLLKWKVMVTGCDGDPLIDRQIELVKIMEQKGVQVVTHFGEGGQHGEETFNPAKLDALKVYLKNFVQSSAQAAEE